MMMAVDSSPELTTLINNGLLVIELTSSGTESLIQELVDASVQSGKLSAEHSKRAIRHLMDRESMGSTVIEGQCIAVPHLRFDYVPDNTAILGVARNGTMFGDEIVNVVLLILVPTGDYFKTMESVGRLVKNHNGLSIIRELSVRGLYKPPTP